ncbi:hypothetical protein Sinac_2596 [Singulisphaera acidiphila DSM 18658]|uniref:DUF2007 domain-containing protein n=1 Tax=Singulisphaera acidiphila (strain ATCC BAA-1392 / DSM 18658 / VKM B-2454 / MOB10) TaxID=886293 RepID=L0DDK5_SINAD|nr:hypothetical protein Sinac_2596 [Singulisphaera acidiphila DSM 18658]
MWTCTKCATKVDPSFEVCWSCGTGRDGVEDPTFVSADSAQPALSPLDSDMPPGNDPIPEAAPPLENLVEAYWASDLMQATFLADKLSEEGMPAVADTHDMHDALGILRDAPRVWVRAVDLSRAKTWLEAYDLQYKTEHGEPDRH